MIDTIKKGMERVKSSSSVRAILSIRDWFKENVIKRKLLIFGVLFAAWLSLLVGAFYSPERQTYSDDQLKTKQTFSNGTGEIKLTSQTYSPDTGIIVLQFETKDATSSVDRGIDTSRLEWALYAQNKTDDTIMEVIPIVDNKITVIIRNVPTDFGAYAIDITNNTVSTRTIDIDIADSSDEAETTQAVAEEDDNMVQFYVTTQNPKMETETIENVSREEFTLSEIEAEIEFQEGQIEKLNASIEQLKDSIEDDESRKKGLLLEAEYLTGDDLESNQKDIATLETNIETKNRSIETANENIETVELKIGSLKKKKTAVEDGTYEFSNPIETVEME